MDDLDRQTLARVGEEVNKLKEGQESIKRNLDVIRVSLDTMRMMLESLIQRLSAGGMASNAPTLPVNPQPLRVSCIRCGAVVLPRNLSRHMKMCSQVDFDINQPVAGTSQSLTGETLDVNDTADILSDPEDTSTKRKRGRPPKDK